MWFPVYFLYVLASIAVALIVIAIAAGSRRKLLRNSCIAAGAVGGVAALYLFASTGRAVVFTGTRGSVHHERLAVLGLPKVATVKAMTSDPSLSKTWVINQTNDVVLEIRVVYYSTGGRGLGVGGERAPLMVPPGTAQAYEQEIDFIGPGSSPPGEIMSRQDYDGRTWITW